MEKFRSKILACFLAVALVVLTTPIGLSFDTRNNSIEIQTNKAHAVVPVAGAAAAFLAEVAAASGLTVGEFVATVVGMAAVGTGIGLATDAGINYGNAASVNLGNLIDAADYPSWDSLTSEQQEAWGTKEYYDSAKFNSLLDAFDLGDARTRFYSSSGGNIDYTESETATLEKIGRIGTTWVNGASNSINDIVSTFRSGYKTDINNFVGHTTTQVFYKSDFNTWNEYAPSSITVNKALQSLVIYQSGSEYRYSNAKGQSDIYWVTFIRPFNDTANRNFVTYAFSDSPFTFGYITDTSSSLQNIQIREPTNYSSASSKTYSENGRTYYYANNTNVLNPANIVSYNLVTSGEVSQSFTNAHIRDVIIPSILFDEDLNISDDQEFILGYPEDIEEDENQDVYYPEDGVNPNMTWVNFTTPPESNPGTGGEVDLTEIIQLLQRFHFTVDYNLLVQDNPLRSAVMELVSGMNKFNFYAGTGQLKVHDEGVFDAVGDLGTYLGGLLTQIQSTLSGFFVTDTATDVIGDLDFPDLGDKAVDLVETISTLAPFGAMFLISELVAILSQVGKIQTPSMVFDFNFMPEHEYDLTVDLSWLDDAKPIINVACIITLIVALAGTTARLIELEAAA